MTTQNLDELIERMERLERDNRRLALNARRLGASLAASLFAAIIVAVCGAMLQPPSNVVAGSVTIVDPTNSKPRITMTVDPNSLQAQFTMSDLGGDPHLVFFVDRDGNNVGAIMRDAKDNVRLNAGISQDTITATVDGRAL